MANQTALQWYRTLLATTRVLFRGDERALRMSHKELRSKFEQSRQLTNPTEIQTLLETCEEANTFMRNNVVQARKTERGTWAIDIKDPNVDNTKSSSHVLIDPIHPSEALDKMKRPPIEIKTSGGKRQ